MCSIYTCVSLGNRSCENIGNMHLFPTEVAKREAVVLPGARWAWMGPVVKCCSQTQHRLQTKCAKCISVHLEGSWYWACRQITTQDKGHKVHGCLPRCVIFQISIQEPPHISVAENPTPQCDLLERWHLLFTSQPVFLLLFSTAGGGRASTLALTCSLLTPIVTSFSSGTRWISRAAGRSACSLGGTSPSGKPCPPRQALPCMLKCLPVTTSFHRACVTFCCRQALKTFFCLLGRNSLSWKN